MEKIYFSDDGCFEDLEGNRRSCLYHDEYGNLVKRTKHTHPYNYDGFVLWESLKKDSHTDYSDRLW